MDSILRYPLGPFDANCYFVYPKNNGTLFIIDPGGDPDFVIRKAEEFQPSSVMVLLTHAHADHIGGAGGVVEYFNLPGVMLHENDKELYSSPLNAFPPMLPRVTDLPSTFDIKNEDDFTVIPTPGHSSGSVCYYFKSLNAVFTGDTLFAGSVGRTDLPGSLSFEELLNNIRSSLFTLPGNTKVFPGHGTESTIAAEISENPYFL